jgi:hypothetical protein
MRRSVLTAIRDLIQEDVGKRGLATVPGDNLLTARPNDFSLVCRTLARRKHPHIGIVTGFYIPHANPPAAETDGPLGALFLARALVPLDARVFFITDPFCVAALRAGLAACGLDDKVALVELPPAPERTMAKAYGRAFAEQAGKLTHLIALERVGPSHATWSVHAQGKSTQQDLVQFRQEIPEDQRDRCRTMRGLDITANMRPAHLLFEWANNCGRDIKTIGIGDGGNEIGMGCIPWRVIRQNIPNGGLVACRVPTDYLIVCGVSNWGAYGLAAGVLHLRKVKVDSSLFNVERERELLRVMVERGPLVDGVSGQPTVTVDGLSFERYAALLPRLKGLLEDS